MPASGRFQARCLLPLDAGRLFIAERNRGNLLRCCLLGCVVELTVLEKHCDAGHKRIRSANLAKPCWSLPVILGGIITALAADDLIRVSVVRVTAAETGWLAPKCNFPVRFVLLISYRHRAPFAAIALRSADGRYARRRAKSAGHWAYARGQGAARRPFVPA